MLYRPAGGSRRLKGIPYFAVFAIRTIIASGRIKATSQPALRELKKVVPGGARAEDCTAYTPEDDVLHRLPDSPHPPRLGWRFGLLDHEVAGTPGT